jgi:DNA-binding transcriptional regulator/RsmH inhibitor MraZ
VGQLSVPIERLSGSVSCANQQTTIIELRVFTYQLLHAHAEYCMVDDPGSITQTLIAQCDTPKHCMLIGHRAYIRFDEARNFSLEIHSS